MISALSSANIWKNQLFRPSFINHQIVMIQSVAIIIFGVGVFAFLYGAYGLCDVIKKERNFYRLNAQRINYFEANNREEYFKCLKEIEKLNPVYIKSELAWCYIKGFGVNKDEKIAFQLYEQIEKEQPSSYAKRMLADCYRVGAGVEKNELKAFQLYKNAAEAGDVPAQVQLGNCYHSGEGVLLDKSKVFYWYERASNAGDFTGKYNLALCYDQGWGVTKDPERYTQLLKEIVNSPLASQELSSESIVSVFYSLEIRNINETGLARGLTPESMAEVLFYLGKKYLIHAGLFIDELTGMRLIKQAAKMGFAEAQERMATFYFYGLHVKKDLKKAFKWYSQAAENGSSRAKLCLRQRFLYEHI